MKTEQLSAPQIMTLTVSAIFGVDVLVVQRELVTIARQDAWISLALGGILIILMGIVCYYLACLYPNMDFPQIILHVCGKFFGRLLLLPALVYDLLYTGLSLRIFAQALKMFLLSITPMVPIILFMALAAAYAVYKGIYTIGGIVDIIFPICAVTALSIIVLPLRQTIFSNLKPILFENTGNVIKGILPGFHQFTGFGIITFLFCYTRRTKGILKWYLAGLGIPIFLYVALTMVTIMVFGPSDVQSLIYPTLTLAKSIEFPGTFLERVESFVAVLWIGIVFVSVVLFLFKSTRNITVFLGLDTKYQSFVIWTQIPLLLGIALFIKNALEVIEFFSRMKYMDVILGLFVIPFVTAVALLKKRKETNQ